jgi:hypothetical protein
MNRPVKTNSGASIVVRGAFEPITLAPAWLRREGLITDGEADQAEIEVIFRDVVRFSVDSVTIEATKDRILIRTQDERLVEPMKDLMVGILRRLPNIRVTKLGLNHERRYSYADASHWNALGDRLTPKETWGNSLTSPGMLSLTLRGNRPDRYAGHVRVRVDSASEEDDQFGVVIDINDHFDLDYDDEVDPGAEAAGMVLVNWRESVRRAETLYDTVLAI